MSIGIVLCFFSGCPAELPKKHAVNTMNFALDTGVPVSFAQVIRTGEEPLPVPAKVISQVFESDDYIFFKENLWNLAANKLDVDNLIFLDSDVYINNPAWVERTESSLQQFDFVQPFSECHWLTKGGKIELTRPSSCTGLSQGVHPKGGVYHPGFGLAMTRRLYEFMGGLLDGAVFGGGGDGANILAHSRLAGTDQYLERLFNKSIFKGYMMEDHRRFFHSPSWIKYRQRSVDYGVRVGYVPDQHVYHLWHGERRKRRYTTRAEFFDWPYENQPVEYREDGLQRWTCPQPRSKAYYLGRDEDGAAQAKRPGRLAPILNKEDPWYLRILKRNRP